MIYWPETDGQALCRWNRAPVVGVLEGNPPTDMGQQVIKLGPAQSEVPLKAAVIQAQLLEEVVKLTKTLKDLMDPDTAPNESTPFFQPSIAH